MRPLTAKPNIPDVLDDFVAYRLKPENSVWGSLHVVLDDSNTKNVHVQGCIEYAKERGDQDGVRLGEILMTMSRAQRGRLPEKVDARMRDSVVA